LPQQAETLARAKMMGSLTLALRSIVDFGGNNDQSEGNSVVIYRGLKRENYSCSPNC